MELTVFLAVIAAAAMHAGWNAVLKIRLDPFLAVVLVNIGCGIIALPVALIVGLPNAQSVPWVLGSIAVHLFYYLTLTGAYRRADMSQVYPVARGSAPLMTTVISLLFLGESVGPVALAGVVILALGIMTMAIRAGGKAFDRKALLLALACGVSITAYTILDGKGARIAQTPHVYAAWLFVGDGIVLPLVALFWKGPAALKPMAGFVGPGLAGGLMSLGAYWIAIWAMGSGSPIGLVAAVRESSVLFGAVIAVLFLREPLQLNRILAACLILIGLALIRLN